MKKGLSTAIKIALLLAISNMAVAQDYKNAAGLRLGAYNGLSFKTFSTKTDAFDLTLSFRNNDARKDVRFTALYEIHTEIENAYGVKWYYGAGGSIGSRQVGNSDGKLFLSADGVLGLDYKFSQAPFNISLDWRPRFVISPSPDVSAGDFGLGVRYTF